MEVESPWSTMAGSRVNCQQENRLTVNMEPKAMGLFIILELQGEGGRLSLEHHSFFHMYVIYNLTGTSPLLGRVDLSDLSYPIPPYAASQNKISSVRTHNRKVST